ncbi:MAG: hypothetical protein ACI9DG_002921 [Oleispira sp.]|jgi:hypothetical protein
MKNAYQQHISNKSTYREDNFISFYFAVFATDN